jgi:hypothetical protein
VRSWIGRTVVDEDGNEYLVASEGGGLNRFWLMRTWPGLPRKYSLHCLSIVNAMKCRLKEDEHNTLLK